MSKIVKLFFSHKNLNKIENFKVNVNIKNLKLYYVEREYKFSKNL